MNTIFFHLLLLFVATLGQAFSFPNIGPSMTSDSKFITASNHLPHVSANNDEPLVLLKPGRRGEMGNNNSKNSSNQKENQPPPMLMTEEEATKECKAPCCNPNTHDHAHDDHHYHEDHSHDHDEPIVPNTDLLKIKNYSADETLSQAQLDPRAIAFVDQLPELKQILNENVYLAVCRPLNTNAAGMIVPDFLHVLSNPAFGQKDLPSFEGMVLPSEVARKMKKRLLAGVRNSHSIKHETSVDEIKSGLPIQVAPGIDEGTIHQLVDHIEDLVQTFSNIANEAGYLNEDDGQLPFVSVRLKVVGTNGCAFWHQDCVPFRMVATFRGPCTEWVPPEYSNETLERRRFDSEHAISLSHCDVALFKGRGKETSKDKKYGRGESYEDYDQPGIVHRSPRLDGSGIYRLVLVVDIPQDDGWPFGRSMTE